MSGRLTTTQKQLAFRLRAQGWSLVEVGRQIGCSAPMVGLLVRAGRHRRGVPDDWTPRSSCLSILEREQILLGVHRGESMRSIARALGRAPSTVSRELAANGGRAGYAAWHAHQRARASARRPKPYKLRSGKLLDEVTPPGHVVVAPGDRPTLTVGVSERSHHACQSRDHLSILIRPGQG